MVSWLLLWLLLLLVVLVLADDCDTVECHCADDDLSLLVLEVMAIHMTILMAIKKMLNISMMMIMTKGATGPAEELVSHG